MRKKKCKYCGIVFEPERQLQQTCSVQCAIDLVNKKKKQKLDKEYREKKTKLKTRREWLKEAQQAINKYVRLRDINDGCVSCDKPSTWNGQWHASHFRSVGASPQLRFNLWNIHKSCSICNNWKSGNLSEYEPRLRKKIGGDKVDWLRSQNDKKIYSVDYLKRLKYIFNKKYNRLLKKHLLQ